MPQYTKRTTPVLLGAAVCTALANVLGTALFNLTVWITVGGGTPITEAYSHALSNPWYVIFAFGAQAFASAMGGYAAASLSSSQPYLNAMMSGILLCTWYVVMLATPVTVVTVNTMSMISWFLLPAPLAIFGAYIFKRQKK